MMHTPRRAHIEHDRPAIGQHPSPQARFRGLRWAGPLVGLSALVWFLVRVVPKPSRAAYPCQRAAAPLASAFVIYLLGLVGLLAIFRGPFQRARRARRSLVALSICAALVTTWWTMLHLPVNGARADFTPTDPPNSPFGTARGIYPGRVAWVHDPNATSWDGSSGYWWSDANTSQAAVDAMLANALRWLSGSAADTEAWDRLFHHFNQTHGRGDVGYQAGQRIAIKINLNNSFSYAGAGNSIDASPQTVRAMLRQLVNQAGVPQDAITVYDAIRYVPDHIYNPCHSEFPAVRFLDTAGSNGRILNEFVSGVLHFSNGQIGPWASDLARCLVEADYVINLAILKRHAWCAPLTVCGKNHLGSISGPGDLHEYIYASSLVDYDAQVDLIGHQHIGRKTLLFMLDGLYGSRNVVDIGSRWSMPPFNNDWPSSVFVSQDPIAIDSVAMDFIRTEMTAEMWPGSDRYLHEGALANDPPSGVFYDPEADGTRLPSLGVHEHWNDATAKLYSRNLDTGPGIELVAANPGANALPSVALTAPSNGAFFPPSVPLGLEAGASDVDGDVALVEFFADGETKLGDDDEPPYQWTWVGATTGTHTVTARAVDTAGATAWSASISVIVGQAGDYDGDGQVDLDDFASFTDCLTGPEQPIGSAPCAVFDFDADTDVDLADFAGFQVSFTP